jgi:hypothetical protein
MGDERHDHAEDGMRHFARGEILAGWVSKVVQSRTYG